MISSDIKDNANEPNGIGGWLLLPIASLFLSIYEVLKEFIDTSIPLLGPEMWVAFKTPGTYFYHSPWVPVIVIGALLQIIIMIVAAIALMAIFKKMKIVPRIMIGFYILGVCFSATSMALGYFFIPIIGPEMSSELISDGNRKMVIVSIVAIIWISYFLKSRRVKNTFIY